MRFQNVYICLKTWKIVRSQVRLFCHIYTDTNHTFRCAKYKISMLSTECLCNCKILKHFHTDIKEFQLAFLWSPAENPLQKWKHLQATTMFYSFQTSLTSSQTNCSTSMSWLWYFFRNAPFFSFVVISTIFYFHFFSFHLQKVSFAITLYDVWLSEKVSLICL